MTINSCMIQKFVTIDHPEFRRIILMIVMLISGIWLGRMRLEPPAKPRPDYPKPYRIGKTWYQPLPDAKIFGKKASPHGTAGMQP